MNVGRAINALCRKTYWYNEVLFPDCAKFWYHHTFNLDVVNLGSTSGVHAFNYEGVNLKCANWALSHNPLSGDEAILKNYVSYLKPSGSTVIFSLCPFSSLAGSYECHDDRYYTLLYSSSIPSFSKHQQTKVMHMKNRPIKYYPFYEMFRDLGKAISAPLLRGRKKVYSEEQMKKDAENWMKGWKLEFSLKSFDTPLSLINQDAINDARIILQRMLLFCEERDMVPIIVIPPVYHTLGEYFSEEAKRQIIDGLLSFIKDSKVRILNYMDDPSYNKNPEFFLNSFFLNGEGAKRFTKQVFADIGLI